MRKEALTLVAGAVAALAVAAPATANPTTLGARTVWSSGSFNIELSGRTPANPYSTCDYYAGYGFQWGASPDALTRSESAYECWSGEYTATVLGEYLWGGTPYYFRAAANGSSTVVGETKSFVTPVLPPTVEEGWATEIEPTSFTVRGAIADEGALTTWRVRYGVRGGPLDKVTPVQQLPGDGGPPQEVAVPVSGLTPGTHYTFRFEAENAQGRTVGPETTVGAGATAPEVAARVVRLTDTEITVKALVDANGLATEEISLDPWDHPWTAPYPWSWDPVGDSFAPVELSVRYVGLQPDTAYHVGWRARNDLGVVQTPAIATRTLRPGQVWEEPPPAPPTPTPPADPPGGGGDAPLVPVSPGGTIIGEPEPFGASAPNRASAAERLGTAAATALARGSIRTLLRGGLTVGGLRADAPGRLELALRPSVRAAKGKGARPVLARGAYRFTRAGTAAVRLRATKAGRAWLRGRRGATLELATSFRPASGGAAARDTAKVILRR